MRALLQRVRRGAVSIDGEQIAAIGRGVVILLGVGRGDGPGEADWLAEKTAHLRIFEDAEGKTNWSLLDIAGEALVISQFTLYANTRKGRRPSFVGAAPPEAAAPLVERYTEALSRWGVPVQTGVFGAHMLVEIENDGPVTVMLEREPPAG